MQAALDQMFLRFVQGYKVETNRNLARDATVIRDADGQSFN
jgi:hypothetical protein